MIPLQIWKFVIKSSYYCLLLAHFWNYASTQSGKLLPSFTSERLSLSGTPFLHPLMFLINPISCDSLHQVFFFLCLGFFLHLYNFSSFCSPFFMFCMFFTSVFRMMLMKNTFFSFCPSTVNNTVIDVYMKKKFNDKHAWKVAQKTWWDMQTCTHPGVALKISAAVSLWYSRQ